MSMGYIQKLIESNVPGIYVHSLKIGNNDMEVRGLFFFLFRSDPME